MRAQKCSLCNRPAAWSISDELFCELHKERIVSRHGLDRFSVKRISLEEKSFVVHGGQKNNEPDFPPSGSPESN